jgi:hypothetical protein
MSNIADVDVPEGWQEWVNDNGVPYYEHTETVSGPCYKPCAPRGHLQMCAKFSGVLAGQYHMGAPIRRCLSSKNNFRPTGKKWQP